MSDAFRKDKMMVDGGVGVVLEISSETELSIFMKIFCPVLFCRIAYSSGFLEQFLMLEGIKMRSSLLTGSAQQQVEEGGRKPQRKH